MKAGWKSRAGWIALMLAVGAFVIAPDLRVHADAQAGLPANVTVNPDLYNGLTFRNLTVFSRGGRVTAVAGVPSNDQLYYMGGTGGGVWRTTDAGANWTNISDGFFEVGSIGAIAVAESDPNIIYVGTGSADPRGNVSPGIGIYKSTDAGKTWTWIGLRNAGAIGRIVIHPTNPDLVYVAVLGNLFGPNSERGVYRSRDGGKTWERVHYISDRTGAIDVTMDMKNPNTLIAAMWTTQRSPWSIDSGSTEGGMFRSTDGGNTWQKLTGGLPTKVMVGKIGVSISRANPMKVYALVEAGGDEGGFFRSDDGGTTWTRTFTGRNLQQRAFYYTKVYADPVDVDTVYAQNTGFYRSTDGGKTFQGISVPHGDNHGLWINPLNNKAMIESNDGGANVSLNAGQSWSGQDNQPTAEIYRIETDTRWPYWIYGAQQDNSTIAVPSVGNDEPYAVGGGESGYIAVDPRNPNIIYAGSYGGDISRTDRTAGIQENVRVYADMETGQRAADMKYRFQWNAPIRLSPHNPDVVYTTSQYVHKSTDGGQNWTVVSPDLTRNDKRRQDYSGGEGITRDSTGVEVYSTIFAFEESPVTPGLLWAGSDDGLMHISRDNGKTWTNITPPGLPEACINVIDLSTHDPGRANIAVYRYRQSDFRPYIYQTNDYGKTWKRIADGTNGIPDNQWVRVVREDPARPGLLYAGTEFGLYVSFDDGAHWQSMQGNLPHTPVTDLRIYRDDLIVSTQGRAFWILDDLSPLRSLRPAAQTPAAVLYKPADAYRQGSKPPTFTYWFRDAPTSPVTVQVSDAQGQVVFTTTAQPGTELSATALLGGGGRGGRGGRGGGRGRGGFGGGPAPAAASAVKGLNHAVWSNLRLTAPYTVPPGIVMWGGGGGGPKPAPGQYTVKVSSGTWSATETFRLNTDPRYEPAMTDAEGAEQLRMALEVGGMVKDLYDNLARIRDVKSQAADRAEKAGASSPVTAAAKTLKDKLEAVEGDMTQMQGEGGQDALNFPGRMDNQLIALYQNIVGGERKLGSPVLERYKDLKPEAEGLKARWTEALKTDVAAFNTVVTRAGLPPVVVK